MKKLLIIIALAIIPTLMSASSVSAADPSLDGYERIPFTDKPVTPGVPESYIGTYGQCPFYENAMEKGCYPPSDIKCNSDWSKCDYVGTSWTPETPPVSQPTTNASNTAPTPQSSSNVTKQADTTQNTASNSTTQTNNDDQPAEMQAKPSDDLKNDIVLANANASNDDFDKQSAGIEKGINSLVEFYIAAFGVAMWIVLMVYIHVKHPTFFRDALNFYKEKLDKLAKRR